MSAFRSPSRSQFAVHRLLRDLVAWAVSAERDLPVESAASQRIDLLQSKYTMESERHAHAAALQPVLALALASTTGPAFDRTLRRVESPAPQSPIPPATSRLQVNSQNINYARLTRR